MTRKRLVRIGTGVLAGILLAMLGYYVAGRIRQAHIGEPDPLVGEDDEHSKNDQEPPPPRPTYKALPRERLRYDVTSWLGKSGEFAIAVGPLRKHEDGRATYRVTCDLATSKAVSSVYVLQGQLTAVLDAETLLPLEFEERVNSGLAITSDIKHKKLVYDQDAHVVRAYEDEGGGLELRDEPREVPADAHHYLSMPYFIRHLALRPGASFDLVLSGRKRDAVAALSVLREEDLALPSGRTRPALVAELTCDVDKKLMKGARFVVWLDQAEHYPLRIDAYLSLGTITATLAERVVGAAASGRAGSGPGGQPEPAAPRDASGP
ncbi:MAG: DUF3108 domain-containing protein [Planctomycetota bacterium]